MCEDPELVINEALPLSPPMHMCIGDRRFAACERTSHDLYIDLDLSACNDSDMFPQADFFAGDDRQTRTFFRV